MKTQIVLTQYLGCQNGNIFENNCQDSRRYVTYTGPQKLVISNAHRQIKPLPVGGRSIKNDDISISQNLKNNHPQLAEIGIYVTSLGPLVTLHTKGLFVVFNIQT